MARNQQTPRSMMPVEALPEGLLAKTPTRHLTGPKKRFLDRIGGTWQTAERVQEGQIDGKAAWSFDYTTRIDVGTVEPDLRKDRSTVVVVDRGSRHSAINIRERDLGSRLLDKWMSPGFEIGAEAFDKRFLIWVDDENAALRFFGPQMQSLLLGSPKGVLWDIGGQWLVAWTDGFSDQVQLVSMVAQLVPLIPPALDPA